MPSPYFNQLLNIFPVYVDASEMCNDLVFQLGTNGNGATIMPRAWNIKVLTRKINIFIFLKAKNSWTMFTAFFMAIFLLEEGKCHF